MKRIKAVYFIGIGGTGMQPLAYFARSKGLKVGGSDIALSLKQKEAFQKRNIILHDQSDLKHLADYDTVVYSSAISREHPQRSHIAQKNSPKASPGPKNARLLHRMDFLNLCMRECSYVFAVAGTHGKSSSTAMLAWLLLQCGLNPHVILGARPLFLEQSFHIGSGQLGLYESDESDASFLKSEAGLRLLLNIDEDHLEYYGTMSKLREAFRNFCRKAELLAVNVNDPILEEIANASQISSRIVFFSCWQELAQMHAYLLRSRTKSLAHYTGYFLAESDILEVFVSRNYEKEGALLPLGQVKLKLPGRHFALNALGVLALAIEASRKNPSITLSDFPMSHFTELMNAFPGLERRLERMGSFQGACVYDDYAHHPTELRAVLEALRRNLSPKGRLIAIFQAHRYSRTASLYSALAEALGLADKVFLLPIYAAGEEPLEGVDAKLIYNSMRQAQHHCCFLEEKDIELAYAEVHPEDIIIALGAGSISQLLRQSLADNLGFIPYSPSKDQGRAENTRGTRKQ